MSVEIGGKSRRGKTQYEDILRKLWEGIGVQPLTDNYICLKCGQYYQLPDPNNYPTHCKKCGDFDRKNGKRLQGQFVIPDLIIKNEDSTYADSVGVIYVNGYVHTKQKQKKKDEYQIEQLVKLGYKVFVFENEDVEILRDQKTFITHAALRHIYSCIKFVYKYQQLLEDEKEMSGVEIIRGFAPWVKS